MLISLRRFDELTEFKFPNNFDDIKEQSQRMDEAEPVEPQNEPASKSMKIKDRQILLVKGLMYQLGIVDVQESVTDVTGFGKGVYPTSYSVKLNSSWCFNHGEEHTSQHVCAKVHS
jgi:hypothetical protein